MAVQTVNTNAYVNVWSYLYRDGFPYHFFVGGRGTGKTFSGLRGCIENYLETGERFVYMRRTGKELGACMDSRTRGEGINPFKAVNEMYGWNYGILPTMDGLGTIYARTFDDNGKVLVEGEPLGYAVALTTLSGLRGVDMTDCSYVLYDEFIPEKHVHKINGEGEAFLNALETIGRNRELQGKAPLKVLCLANAFNIYNQIFLTLGLINRVERMISRGQTDAWMEERGVGIHLLDDTEEFLNAKSNTALYKLAKGTQFYDLALSNDFVYNDFSLIEYKNIKGYRPLCNVDDYGIWKKKESKELYMTYNQARVRSYDTDMIHERREFLQDYGRNLLPYFTKGWITFETYEIKQKWLDLLCIK